MNSLVSLSMLFWSLSFFLHTILVKYAPWVTVKHCCDGDLSGGTLQGRVWLGDYGVEVDWQEMLLLSNCSLTVTAYNSIDMARYCNF